MKNLSRFSKLFLSLAMVVGVLFGAVQGVSAYNERTIICSGGSYFDKYGPGAYWTEHGSMGWCHNPTNWCENGQCGNNSPYNGAPYSMWKTYSGCSLSNYARWNMGNIAQWSYWYTFVPSNYATTTAAPYQITYNGGSGYSFTINQNAYSNRWISLPTTSNYYQVMNTWLTDVTCEGSTRQVGFDETEICKEADSSSAYCPGSHNP